MAPRGNLAEMKAQGLFDPEDVEGMDEKDFESLEAFHVLDSQSRPLDAQASVPNRLVRNVYAQVMPGRDSLDITSLRIAAWTRHIPRRGLETTQSDEQVLGSPVIYQITKLADKALFLGDPVARYISTQPLNRIVSSTGNLPSRIINIRSEVQTMESSMADCVEFIECFVAPWSSNAPLGRVRDGFLKLRGFTKILIWDGQLHDLEGIDACELQPVILPVEWSEEIDEEDVMDRIFGADRIDMRYSIPET
ncbi:hypothetical protein VTL71DRAFT_13969 [Oculimacula yallundae]|uniref:Uncharacterized protein n=1 Tax=Oculimacula yallundae TaxID=86028 RepID=A0ABR4CNQ0_9HELO